MNNRTARMDLVFHLAEHWTDSDEPTGIGALERGGQRRGIGTHERFARMALGEVADVPSPKILKLGCGLGGLSRKLLDQHPTAQVTVTDIDSKFVAELAASDLGSHLRRPPAPLHVVVLALVVPIMGLIPVAHDGFISSLRAYSPSVLRALAHYADPAITVEFRTRPFGPTVVVASRARQAGTSSQGSQPPPVEFG